MNAEPEAAGAPDERSKIPRTRRWRVTDDGRKVMGTTMYLREHHFPNVYAGVMH